MDRPDLHETRRAVEQLGGDPVIADAAFSILGPGVEVTKLDVERQIHPLPKPQTIKGQDGQDIEIGGNRTPDATLRMTIDPTKALAENPHVKARREEIRNQLGR